MRKFGLIGAAGFIAPRHMQAIRETGNDLVIALDPHDCVGVLDSYFPDARFFTEFERFDRAVDKSRRAGSPLDFITVCSPNYLHDAHIRFALRSGIDCICEKPIVLYPRNLEPLVEIERETGKKVFTILQLRLHPAIIALKEQTQKSEQDLHDIDLTYITSRGRWYDISWKGDVAKSGGVATNIGVHFFDMLTYIFGACRKNIVHVLEARRGAGYLELERARVRWFLSIERSDLPAQAALAKKTTYRSLVIDGKSVEFSDGFTDLHTRCYEQILAGEGYGLREALPSIQLAAEIRDASPLGLKGEYHPFLQSAKRIPDIFE